MTTKGLDRGLGRCVPVSSDLVTKREIVRVVLRWHDWSRNLLITRLMAKDLTKDLGKVRLKLRNRWNCSEVEQEWCEMSSLGGYSLGHSMTGSRPLSTELECETHLASGKSTALRFPILLDWMKDRAHGCFGRALRYGVQYPSIWNRVPLTQDFPILA
jgi:hypothetical protein